MHAQDERSQAHRPGSTRTVPRRVDDAAVTASRMPGTPHSAVVLQRAIGNQAYSQVVQRAPANAPAVPEGAKIDLTLAEVEARFRKLEAENPQLAEEQRPRWEKLHVVLKEFDAWMRSIEVGYRFGGSLIAYLYGAERSPQDIDIDVSNGDNMTRLFNAMESSGDWSGQTGGRDNKLESIYCKNAKVPEFQFDVSSETTAFNSPFELQESMQVEGDAVISGDKISRDELILNYLDRMIQKPDTAKAKGDDNQVAGLLRATGCRTIADVEAYWTRNIEPAIKAGDPRTSGLRENLASIAKERFAGDGDKMDLD
ncbi:hypothetical protein ABTZ21_02915 [Streptomyces sp. NPDC096191]|uniref:hypothetical protein n=1 Tax=Streptomyces sp. NPDC096191 TaxID=3155426 RepID=UPI00332330A4